MRKEVGFENRDRFVELGLMISNFEKKAKVGIYPI